MNKLISTLNKKYFIDFYNRAAEEIGDKKIYWPLLDDLFDRLVKIERMMTDLGFVEDVFDEKED